MRMAKRETDGILLMSPRLAYPAFWIIGWCVLVVTSLFCRSLVPIDETRYVGVAWEMWLRSDFLVPFENGIAYSHKPPLLFWMIHVGWGLFGVNEWWPRIVPSLFSLGSLLLTNWLARRIWPNEPLIARLAPTLLLGCLFWAAFTPALMFDMVLAFWVLLGVSGIWLAARGDHCAWWMLIAGIGFGMLTKGPVALLHILPVAALAPLWSEQSRQHKTRWYGMLLLSIVAGAAIILAWAIPAGIYGGEAYREAIFWGQTAGRLSQSFAHAHTWWWYLPGLPLSLFPWFIWWPAWHGLKEGMQGNERDQSRFLLSWTIPVFIAFSAISGKQLHYLLPVYPALAMLVAAGLLRHQYVSVRSIIPISLMLVLLAVFLLATPMLQQKNQLPAWLGEISWLASALLIAASLLLLWLARHQSLERHVLMLASTSLLTMLLLSLFVVKQAAPYYDVTKPSRLIATLQSNNIPIAHHGNYDAQYQFLGRLKKPLPELTPEQVRTWVREHPDGYLVTYRRSRADPLASKAEHIFPYRARWLLIVRASDWPEQPGDAERPGVAPQT